MNVHESAKYINKSEKTLRRWISAGKLKADIVKGGTGKQYEISQEDLNRLISGKKPKCSKTRQAVSTKQTRKTGQTTKSGQFLKSGQKQDSIKTGQIAKSQHKAGKEKPIQKSVKTKIEVKEFDSYDDFEPSWEKYKEKHPMLSLINVILYFRQIEESSGKEGVIPESLSFCLYYYEPHWKRFKKDNTGLTLRQTMEFMKRVKTGVYH